MKLSKSILAAVLLALTAFAAAAAPAPQAETAVLETQPSDVFRASVLSGGDCAAAALRAASTQENGDPIVNCGTCSSLACWGLNIGDYCGHGTSGPRFCLDAYESALCPAEDGIRCLCARQLP